MKMNKLVKSLALTAGIAASFSSYADFVEFTVDESYAAGSGSMVVADKINGGYVERITFDGAGNFTASAFATFGQFFNGSNSLNTGLNNTYSLYATFEAQGTADSQGNVEFFVGDTGGFQIFLDRNNDTGLSDENDVDSVSNTGDDVLLGMSDMIGENLGTSTTINGKTVTAFDFDFLDFSLTSEGDQYFVSPRPFSMMVNVNGDFDSFAQTGEQITRGDVSAQFYDVPEPSTLAVLGIGLLGLGASSRRKA
ncbi:flocculation-associated PEP-CTERM protein PepA [Salinimonas chungwhensis]|uniref:flocculation-associated PEP-CTERM protein PepA n=1 Tax=Salinimonas chungwhensis TaxID=265425 RepID=UPI00036696F9|nr:flocculation-associated PEP-CTERM protein PepA [Salinimonas chungwhensis]